MIKITIGIVAAVICLGVAHSMVGFPFERPIIYYSLRKTQGSLVSTSEDVEAGEHGTVWFHQYTFTYSANGKTFTRSIHRRGRLKPEFFDISDPIPITVVYSSLVPSFAQVDDDGTISFGDYVIRGILGTLFCYGMAIGVIVICVKSVKEEPNREAEGEAVNTPV